MGMNSEAQNQSIERWEKANATLVEAIDRPELMDTLSQSQPETIEELNLQAYNRETVADQATRYLDACDNYFEALDEPLTAEQREEFIMNIPLEPNKLAEVSYYMENMTPEIVRYQRALGEEGFDQEQKQEITETIPRSHDNITEVAQHYAENSEMSVRPYNSMLGQPDHKDEVNAALSTLPPTPSVISAQSFQVEHDLGPIEAEEPKEESDKPANDGLTQVTPVSAYDVVSEGSIQSDTMLSNSFARADAHDGAQSLEVIRATPIEQPDVSVENDIRFQV